MNHKLLFAGSFAPFTIGHKDIVDRALAMGMQVVIAVGTHPDKHDMTATDEREAQIRRVFASEPRVTVTHYEGLTTDFARTIEATALLRSVRSVKDYEYERELADINRRLSGIETILLIARPEYTAVSSSVVRELMRHGHDVSAFLP